MASRLSAHAFEEETSRNLLEDGSTKGANVEAAAGLSAQALMIIILWNKLDKYFGRPQVYMYTY